MPSEELSNYFTHDLQVYYQSVLCYFACRVSRQQVRKRQDSIQSCGFRESTPLFQPLAWNQWLASCSCIITPCVLACWASQIWNIGFCAHAKSYWFLGINSHIIIFIYIYLGSWLPHSSQPGCGDLDKNIVTKEKKICIKILATVWSLYIMSSFKDTMPVVFQHLLDVSVSTVLFPCSFSPLFYTPLRK